MKKVGRKKDDDFFKNKLEKIFQIMEIGYIFKYLKKICANEPKIESCGSSSVKYFSNKISFVNCNIPPTIYWLFTTSLRSRTRKP